MTPTSTLHSIGESNDHDNSSTRDRDSSRRLDRLEGDEYADHLHEPCDMCIDRNPDLFRMEYQEVRTVDHETPDCVAIGFDFDVVGFPTWHMLRVIERREE